MKKIVCLICFLFAFFVIDNKPVSAKEVVVSESIPDITGNPIGTITVYDNSEIKINYKYGLRLVELRYCEEGEACDMNLYEYIKVLDSTEGNIYKNEKTTLEVFRYKPALKDNTKYRFQIDAYFGYSNRYTGYENISTGFMLSPLSVDTNNVYVEGSKSSTIEDEGISNLLSDLKEVVNNVVLPILLTTLGMFLVIKGAILGVQIVKSADDPDVRREKIRGLIWLVIGVAIAMTASTVVGVLTGYFENLL